MANKDTTEIAEVYSALENGKRVVAYDMEGCKHALGEDPNKYELALHGRVIVHKNSSNSSPINVYGGIRFLIYYNEEEEGKDEIA